MATISEPFRDTLKYMLVVLGTFLIVQALVILTHEFTHSTVAWLLGYMENPFGIIWGNPLTMCGWDEGVHYSDLVASGHLLAEAIIGVSPLIMHALVVTTGLLLMKNGRPQNKWGFHMLFWFIVGHLMELIAYIGMRPFASHGDTGHFNHGLGISPWYLFILGSLALLLAIYVLLTQCLPIMYARFGEGNRILQRGILGITAFLLFLWGSGLRVVLYIYPDPQWLFGLWGFLAFPLVIMVFDPARRKASSKHSG